MIDVEYFRQRGTTVEEILSAAAEHLTRRSGLPSVVRLVGALDARTRARVLALDAEVFGPGGEVFDWRDLDEIAEDPDALFMVLEIDGTVEGFCFGYYEEEDEPMVDGTDFFLDSALVAPRWQRHGIGLMACPAALLLVAALGDVRRLGIAVWSGGDIEGLLSLYHRFGFVDAISRQLSHPCLAVTLLPERLSTWRALLGLPPAASKTDHPAANGPAPPEP